MKIIELTDSLRKRAKAHGNYSEVSKKVGLNYHWLQKFALGKMPNPTVSNLEKLERFFSEMK